MESPHGHLVASVFEVADAGPDWKTYNFRQTIVATYGGCKRGSSQMAHDICLDSATRLKLESGTTCIRKQVAQRGRNFNQGSTARPSEVLRKNSASAAAAVFYNIYAQLSLAKCIASFLVCFGHASCLSSTTSTGAIIARIVDASVPKWTFYSSVAVFVRWFALERRRDENQFAGSNKY